MDRPSGTMAGMDFARKLAILCERKNWGQADLCKALGGAAKRSAVSNWFNGGSPPSLMVAKRVADVLGVSLDYLADDSQDEPPRAEELGEGERMILTLARDMGVDEARRRLAKIPDARPVALTPEETRQIPGAKW